jgi:hypothetical protein
MSIAWYGASLRQIDTLKTGLEAVATVTNTIGPAVRAVSLAMQSVPSIADASALAVQAALQALATTMVGALTDVLATGIYVLPVYPTRIDYNLALLKERETTAAEAVTAARATLASAKQHRDPNPQQLRAASAALEAAEKAHRKARLDVVFSGGGPLRDSFSFDAFLSTVRSSLTDAADLSRPQFSSSSICAGVAVVYSVSSLVELTNAMSALGLWMNHPGLTREAGMLSRLATMSAAPTAEYTSPPGPPDWWSASVAEALGLQGQIDVLRRAAANVSVASLVGGSPTAAAVLAYLDNLTRAIADAGEAAERALAVLAAFSAIDASMNALVVPPYDGEKSVTLPTGDVVKMPNFTAGVDGFVSAVQNATNRPTGTWNVGVVFLAGVPAGMNLLELPSSLASIGAAREAAGKAQAAVDLIRGAIAKA